MRVRDVPAVKTEELVLSGNRKELAMVAALEGEGLIGS